MHTFQLATVATLCLFSCSDGTTPSMAQQPQLTTRQSLVVPSGKTIYERILPPQAYKRVEALPNSLAFWLRGIALKPDGEVALLYDGRVKANKQAYVAVIDMEVGNKDLLQCADAVMKLRAEWLYATSQHDKIHFNFTNGFKASWSKWKSGNRISVKGNNCTWVSTNSNPSERQSFDQYLEMVYSYAGTLSLSRELIMIKANEIQPGDVLIQGGSPGHAVTIMDVATDAEGGKIFLLSQGYMPAQDIQILANPTNQKLSPWYSVAEIKDVVQTPEWTFKSGSFMRFPE